jgi:hypothetical protein
VNVLAKLLQASFGLLLVAAFWAFGAVQGFGAEMGRSFVLVGRGELLFWATFFFLLLPGLWLVFAALPVHKLERPAPASPGPAPRLFGRGLLFVLLATLGLVAGRSLLLDDLPITGDENMVLFGSRMVAEGDLSVPAWPDGYGFTTRYFYRQDGRFSSMDFPGAIFFRALLLKVGAGFWPFALLAAFGCWALVQALGRYAGRGAAIFAGVVLVLSPMVVTLSMTEHAHLLSRSLVALGWALYLRILAFGENGAPRLIGVGAGLRARPVEGGHGGPPLHQSLALGTCFAFAFCSRPAEALACFVPVLIHLVSRNWRRSLPLLAAAATGPALLLFYNRAITGSFLVSPRVESTLHLLDPATSDTIWHRLGANSGMNAALLAIYFLGPAILALAAAALWQGSAPARAAAAAVTLQLLVGLAHGDTGIHLVGPIHYSEAAVPLLVLATLGWPVLVRLAARFGVRPAGGIALVCAWAAGQLFFLFIHAGILRQQAIIHRSLYDAVAGLPPAVVVADPVWRLWEVRPDFAAGGTWVVDLPEPDPYFRDRVLFAQAGRADLGLLRQAFPERSFYRLEAAAEGPPWKLAPLPAGP